MTTQELRLIGVQTVMVHGETARAATVKAVQMTMNVDWGFGSDMLHVRFTSTCDLYEIEATGDEPIANHPEALLGRISGTTVAQYLATPAIEPPAGDEWYRDFVRSRAMPDVMPYIRELISSTAARIGFTNVTVDSMPVQGFELPASDHVVDHVRIPNSGSRG